MSQEAANQSRREKLTAEFVDRGAVAVLRLKDATMAAHAIDAICAGGIRAVEITATTPNALALIRDSSRRLGDAVMIGVGSALDVDTARRAIDVGAVYVVSPVFDAEVLGVAHAAGVPAFPGAFSPTEILRAHNAGADIVKVFPAEVLGNPYFRAVLAPMPFLRIMPTGGVTPENAGDWIRAGATAVGIGSALLDPALMAAGNYAALTERARVMTTSVANARNSLSRPNS